MKIMLVNSVITKVMSGEVRAEIIIVVVRGMGTVV